MGRRFESDRGYRDKTRHRKESKLKNRFILGALMALIFSALSVVGFASPAQADVYPMKTTSNQCVNYGPRTTCVQLQWRRQDDGNGVSVEGMWINTNNGCSTLEDSGGKYNPVNLNLGDFVHGYDAEPCNVFKDLEFRGPETGGAYAVPFLKARVDNGGDMNIYFEWLLRNDGTSVFTRKDVWPV